MISRNLVNLKLNFRKTLLTGTELRRGGSNGVQTKGRNGEKSFLLEKEMGRYQIENLRL
jgi:hypothetical protein